MGSSKKQRDRSSTLSAVPSEHEFDGMSGLYLALHDFTCAQQHVLPFKKAQIVEVTKASSSSNWHRGRINGKAGFLPANGYLKRIDLDVCRRVVVRQDFEGATSGQLKIYEGQVVSVIAKNDVQWWTVLSDSGKWGQVPAKYLKEVSVSEGNVTVHTPSESPDIVISRPAPPAPLSRTQSDQVKSSSPVEPDLASVPRSSTISRAQGSSCSKPLKDKRRDVVKISSSLVEGVRRKGVKYQTSKEIVRTVLEKLIDEFPDWDSQLSGLCNALTHESAADLSFTYSYDSLKPSTSNHSQTSLTWVDYPKDYYHKKWSELQSNSVDSLKLEQLFEHLVALTEDEQQRGWICSDDNEEITTMLSDLLALLKNANPKVVVHVLKGLKYEPLLTLVQYYILETRGPLKRLALEVMLGTMVIQPDPVCSIILSSRLPVQLATDIQTTKILNLLELQCDVFSACLSFPNPMPRSHYDQLDESFISHLLSMIEATAIPYDPENTIPSLFLKCILALNIHHQDLKSNKVCAVLKSRPHATHLTEMVLVAFNRADDLTNYFARDLSSNESPSRNGVGTPTPADHLTSVNKLVQDMFSSPDTSELFFTNDVKVLIEVLHRNVIDRGEGDADRVYYLRLLDLVITNSEYQDHFHYKNHILQILQQIQTEDSSDGDSKAAAARILKKHTFLAS